MRPIRAKLINENIDLLSPKSNKEVGDLKNRGFRQDQGKWKFVIYVGDLYFDDDITPYEFGQKMGARLESKVDDVMEYIAAYKPDEDAEYAGSELQNIADEYYMMGDDEDDSDYPSQLAKDFGDEYDIMFSVDHRDEPPSISESLYEGSDAIKIADKDWARMLDLVLSGKDGAGTAKVIKNKDKAIGRFVAGRILAGEEMPDERWAHGSFTDFYEKAIELGATYDEIKNTFDNAVVPEKFQEKRKNLSTKNLSNRFTGDIANAVLKAGADIEFIGKGGNATTWEGKDAMRRNGRKWTIGYTADIIIDGEPRRIVFDAITDEGGGPTQYVVDTNTSETDRIFSPLAHRVMGKNRFISGLRELL